MVTEEKVYKRKWEPSQEAFKKLLNWLDGGEDSHGQKYEEMRRHLVWFFDHKNCTEAEDLTDETFDRVTKWLEQKEAKKAEDPNDPNDPNDVTAYGKNYENEPVKICYTTARQVYLEWWRHAQKTGDRVDDLPLSTQHALAEEAERQEDEIKVRDQRLECLERCLKEWPPETRALISEYYEETKRAKIENRRKLAERLKISSKALSLRVLRLRNKLEPCVKKCVSEHLK